jgi:hypothetical protein
MLFAIKVVEQTDSSTWHTDINEALLSVTKEKKPLFLFFLREVIGADGVLNSK